MLELIVLDSIHFFRREGRTLVLGMSGLSAPLPPRPAFLSHDRRLDKVARRRLGRVAGVFLQPGQAGFQFRYPTLQNTASRAAGCRRLLRHHEAKLPHPPRDHQDHFGNRERLHFFRHFPN
ncbi:MAG: hypothetical protein QM706_11960 [Nitrospira sp.]